MVALVRLFNRGYRMFYKMRLKPLEPQFTMFSIKLRCYLKLCCYLANSASIAEVMRGSSAVISGAKRATISPFFPIKNFSKNFADSEFGTAVGSSIAFPLGVVTKAAQAGIKTAIPKSAARLLNRKLGFIADIVERMPSTATTSAVLAKNLASYAGKVLGSGWSEAIEEGKQYLNGKRYAEGAYAGASDTLMDSILNDIAGGARSAYSFVGDMFGASVDKELIANMKGGFLGGFGHTALISGVNLASDTFQDLRANDFVVNNVMAEKLADRTTISNNAYLATQTSPRQYERIMNAFDNMEQIAAIAEERNGGTEGLNITLQDVKDQRKAY